MITYRISKDLFNEDVTIQLICEHLKDSFRVPARIKETDVKAYKQTHTKQALLMLCSRMAGQRKANYLHSQSALTELHLMAIKDIERCVNYFGGSSLLNVLEVIDKKIISNLETLTPTEDSKFYTNYVAKLNDLKAFTNISLAKLQSSKTPLKMD